MLDNHPKFKFFLHYLLIHPYTARTRLWARIFVTPFIIKKGKGTIIRRTARLDLIPSKKLILGKKVIIEDYVIINNGMGDIIIGDGCKITSRVKIVGPVTLGSQVVIGSGAQITGLTHNFENIGIPIDEQGVTPDKTVIDNDVWIGGNTCINQGLHIGTHVVIGAGSVVTHDIPSYSIAVGNPARVIKTFDTKLKKWVKP